jgi:quercetin dioxygenase-like cupin family protein
MAIEHAQAGNLIDVRPWGAALSKQQTVTLVKTDALEVIRLALPAGHEIATHQAPDEMTAQCLEGRIAFTTMGKTVELTAGSMLYLAAREPHALRALEASSLLVTLLLRPKSAGS